jgi:hypothetical protein
MSPRFSAALALVALTIGCGQANTYGPGSESEHANPGTDDTGAPAEEELVVFAPSQGTWTVLTSVLEQDGCGLEDAVNRGEPGNTAQITVLAPSAFELLFDNGGESTDCAVTSESALTFACDAVEEIDNTARDMGLNADIPFTLMTDGTFVDDSLLELTSEVEIDCDGDDCTVVSILLGTSFPCTMIMSSTMEATN